MVSLQSIIWVFLLNNFSRVINLLLTKLARDRTGRLSALGLSCTDLAALGPYCQDLGPIFSQCGPRAWLIRYRYSQLSLSFLQICIKQLSSKISRYLFCIALECISCLMIDSKCDARESQNVNF